MWFPSTFNRMISLLLLVLMSLFFVLGVYVFPDEFAYGFSFLSFIGFFLVLIYLLYSFSNDDSEKGLAIFLGLSKQPVFTYERIMACISELLALSALISISYVYARFYGSNGYEELRILIAVIVTLFSLLGIAFSILRFVINSCSKNFFYMSLAGVCAFSFSACSVELGLATGKGLIDFYRVN